MKILNKQGFQQITVNHSSDIDFNRKCTAKSFSFLVIDITLASNNSLCFRKNLLELVLHQIILYVSEESFRRNIKTNHDN